MNKLILTILAVTLSSCSSYVANIATVDWQGERLLRAGAEGPIWTGQEDVRRGVLKAVAKKVSTKGFTHFAELEISDQANSRQIKTREARSETTGTINAYTIPSNGHGVTHYVHGTTDVQTRHHPAEYSTTTTYTTVGRFYALNTEEAKQLNLDQPLQPVYSVRQFIDVN